MMKKAMVMAALFALVAGFTACGGALGGQVKGDSFKTEGWVDKDTYRSTATGVPKEGLKNKVQRRGTAKEAAVLMAQSHVIEKFKGAKIEGASGVSTAGRTPVSARPTGRAEPEEAVDGRRGDGGDDGRLRPAVRGLRGVVRSDPDERRRRAGRRRGGVVMFASSVDNWVGLSLAVVAVLYLVFVLVYPERF